MELIRWCTKHHSIEANEGTCWAWELAYGSHVGHSEELELDCMIEEWVATPVNDQDGLDRACAVAEKRLGSRRSITVEEIVAAYLSPSADIDQPPRNKDYAEPVTPPR